MKLLTENFCKDHHTWLLVGHPLFAKTTHYVNRRLVLDVRVAPPLYTNVCKLIKADPKTAVENESVGYFKRWIKGLGANGLAKFFQQDLMLFYVKVKQLKLHSLPLLVPLRDLYFILVVLL